MSGLQEQLLFPPDELVQSYYDSTSWSRTTTIATLLRQAVATRRDHLAVVDNQGGRLTYEELDARSAGLAGALQRRGIGRGDVVGVQLPNRVAAPVVACALARLGAVANMLVPVYREHELVYMGDRCQTKALIVPGTYRKHDHDAMALGVRDEVSSLSLLVSLTSSPPEGLESLEALMREEPAEDLNDLSPDEPAAVLFTSGTESTPKAVLHTHNTLLANARSVTTLLELTEDDNIFMASPVGHGTGFGFGILLALSLGSTLVLQDGWEPREAADMIAEHGCGYTHGATPFVQELSEVPGVTPDQFPRFRWFVTGGATVAPGMVDRVRSSLGCTLLRLYGQTEAFMTTINRPGDPADVLETTDGKPAPGVEVQIRDDAGEVVPVGAAGQAWVRGPHRCLGFLNDRERTTASIDDAGWLATGDLCALDEAGSLTVVGRTKEIINRGGYKFSPREIEDVLSGHSAVQRIAVVRMPDERLGEKACAFVVTRDGADFTLDDMQAALGEVGVAKYKWPERLELVPELPTTASGKVQKYVLEQELQGPSD